MVELKTSRQIENQRMRYSFERYKLLSWWIQSFLAGVPRITVGWRDDDGVVVGVDHLETMKIPKIANADILKWDYRVCLGFTRQLLDWVVPLTRDGSRYTLSYRPVRGEPRRVTLVQSTKECFLSNEERERLNQLAKGRVQEPGASSGGASKRPAPGSQPGLQPGPTCHDVDSAGASGSANDQPPAKRARGE
jgi:hypothetical protein